MTDAQKKTLMKAVKGAHLSCGCMTDAIVIAAKDQQIELVSGDVANLIIEFYEELHHG